LLQEVEVVISMGCGDACPVYPGKRYVDWPLDDPAGQDLDMVRQVREQIKMNVLSLLDELMVEAV
jgi:protein-tyrosine-phosphatase